MVKAWWFVPVLVGCGDNLEPEYAITGQLWADTNGNGVRDADEPALANVLLFANIDADASINAGDPIARSADDGTYRLVVPGPGSYDVSVKLPFGFRTQAMQKRAPIIGGYPAPAAYGFMVAVGQPFGDLFLQNCGGTLIDDRHVVTAAHCSVNASVADAGVLVGTLDSFGESDGEVFAVERITVHPQFFAAQSGNDIAIWTLAEPVPLEELGLTTIDLLDDDSAALAVPGTLATTIGWGQSELDNRFLLQVHLPVVDADDCAAVYTHSAHFETQICAGVPEGGIGPCFGDSGGPLLVRDSAREVWIQAGITSYGNGGCAEPGAPAVFSRVSALSTWAKETAAETVTVTATLAEGELATTRDLPVFSTTRPQVAPIGERWQLTGLDLPATISPDSPRDVHWNIITDTPTLDGFTCRFEPDLAGAAPVQDVPCGLGTSAVSLPAGFPTGIFASELAVSRGDTSFARRVTVVSGTPPTTTTAGALTATDGTDPDYSFATYRIDYYDVSGLAGNKVFAIDAIPSGFTMFMVLYDLDERDFATGGGQIAFGTQTLLGERLVVVPDGRRYVVGVSSLESDAIGGYTISIVNDGTLTPH